MRQIFLISLLVLVFWLLLIALARAEGKQLKTPPTFLETETCPLPCWNGVRPGESSTADFWRTLELIRGQGGWMYSGLASSLDEEGAILTEFKLTVLSSRQIRFGDALLIYGAPDAVRVVRSGSLSRLAGMRQLITEVYIFWADGHVEMIATEPSFRVVRRITPEMWIRELRMNDPKSEPLTLSGSRRWRGFGNTLVYEFEAR